MTGKEFLIDKMKSTVKSFENKDYVITIIPTTIETGFRFTIKSKNENSKNYYFENIWFDATAGVDYENIEYVHKRYPDKAKFADITRDFADRIQKATAMLRFYYSKNFTIRDIKNIFNLSDEDIPKTGKNDRFDISNIDGYPEKVTGKGGVRIKVYDPSANKPWYSQKIYRTPTLGKLTKDKTKFTVNLPTATGLAHGAELTFLNQDDAEDFVRQNSELFSKFKKEDIVFSKTQTHSFQKVPVEGTDKAYATTYYIKWRETEGKPMPINA